ncbi:PHP domain-containing protein [Williamwhitmania taraxaci]|uniref:Polymerase/histidinol phosphatase N-terminal domain-containing protein n=1 Tax=Williamwhitmania taraxaci TaxID=1640674 RepID=A0A1G6NS75_9BACT|nr:PHP domain-containing protein [Williamwhitmania taraxaci]SDC70224.1 hypothetical protein SAMN05216323_104511 [Williamwhitmania taraxaci]
MRLFKADLHLHSVLSPCGSLEMSPGTIVSRAKEVGLDIIAVTDHNTTLHCQLTQEIASEAGIALFFGAEITTKEEAHCLTYFPDYKSLSAFQQIVEKHYPVGLVNDPAIFGYQVVLDRDENIIQEVEVPLISSLTIGINELERIVHELGGLFIPAHINKTKFSVISQLGFLPPDLLVDGVEISRHTSKANFLKKNAYLSKYTFIQNSDAHLPEGIGEVFTVLQMEEPTFNEFKLALQSKEGRNVLVD